MTITWKKLKKQRIENGHLDELEVKKSKDLMLGEVRAYKLAELRAVAGMSQQELASQLNVSQSRISKIEHGDLDKTELVTLRKFVAALGGELELTLKLGDERYTLG